MKTNFNNTPQSYKTSNGAPLDAKAMVNTFKMDKLKKTNIEQGAQKCPSVSTNNCPDNGPFFNPDYFGHVVVQTVEELNSIPCKLRQDGMVASIVQDEYSEWQLQSSKTGFGVCDNRSWVKLGSTNIEENFFIMPSKEVALEYIKNNPSSRAGQIFYITEEDTYYKYDGVEFLIELNQELEWSSNNWT